MVEKKAEAPGDGGLRMIPAAEAVKEEVATLALEDRDGRTVVVVSEGHLVPARLEVVSAAGEPLASYVIATADAPAGAQGRMVDGTLAGHKDNDQNSMAAVMSYNNNR